MSEYKSHAVPTEISATSRCALKIKDNFYTVEVSEKRAILDASEVDMDAEYKLLFDEVNGVVDAQCEDIIKTFAKPVERK